MKTRYFWLSFALTAVATSASADTMTVHLRSGGMVQGEVIESIPGDHTTVRLSTGEARRFSADEIISTALTTTTTLTPSYNQLAPAYAGQDAVTVHIESNKPGSTYLYRVSPGGPDVGWYRLCSAPCDMGVDPTGTYKVGGERITDSAPFHVQGQKENLFVDASGAGTGAFGYVSLGLGVALAIPGTYLLATSKKKGPDDDSSDGKKIAGFVLLANGLPWLITGIVLVAVSGTTVKTETGAPVATVTPKPLDLGHGLALDMNGVSFLPIESLHPDLMRRTRGSQHWVDETSTHADVRSGGRGAHHERLREYGTSGGASARVAASHVARTARRKAAVLPGRGTRDDEREREQRDGRRRLDFHGSRRRDGRPRRVPRVTADANGRPRVALGGSATLGFDGVTF